MNRMTRIITVLFFLLFFSLPGIAANAKKPLVNLQTTEGLIVLELDAEKAPETVKNFLNYIKMGFYDGTIFHRVISNFMIQGGGYTTDLQKKTTNPPVKNEADNGLQNLRGTIAMARTNDPHSATAQFFINVVDNNFLDHRQKSVRGWGYAVFGRVIEGMEIVDKIRKTPTGGKGPFPTDVPKTTVMIEKMSLAENSDK